jgi:D-alanine--poly(phosphoribitol) ligase subunit 1
VQLLERIADWVRAVPDRPAHISAGRILTYGELGRRSTALAQYLLDEHPDDRSPVAVVGHKEPEMLVAFLGAAKAGRPYVPIDTSLPVHRQQRIIEVAGAGTVLTPTRVDVLSDIGASSAAPQRPLAHPDASDLLYIIFTSGSTGEPKGVCISHACLASFVTWMLAEHQFVPGGETFLNQAPFSFDLSVMDLYLSLVTGGTLYSLTADDVASPAQLYRTLKASQATVWVSTPSFAQLCLADPGFSSGMMPAVRRFLFCGETLAPTVAEQLLNRFPAAQVWNTYGPTEATVATTSVRVTRATLEMFPALPVGVPKPGTQILIRDEGGRNLSAGQRGEVVVVGPNVSPGYLGAPELTARAFFDLDKQRAYRTGDYGRLLDGLLFFDGRIDGQVKVNGYRIELGDVEANLRADALVRDAIVVRVARPGRPDSLAAFVVLTASSPDAERDIIRGLRTRLAERVPTYMLPRTFRLLDRFPMTSNGKADRQSLAASLGHQVDSHATGGAPLQVTPA